ncbi:hypothetical protein [Sediminibacterium sp.]|uniref:hypothetical protein n=1 Tax=Sediminibacterium sp. TaxID=1917865 RepID=UPI0025D8A896|nr:hypothetical protein [Sediminibacterium sp.]MBW0176590.1 hypothetical protein [Sediminibacterium sp.]
MYIQHLQPNIILNDSYLTVMSEQAGNLILKVLDVNGHMAKTIVEDVSEGLQQLVINLGDLASGNYILNAFSGDVFIKAIRFSKQ